MTQTNPRLGRAAAVRRLCLVAVTASVAGAAMTGVLRPPATTPTGDLVFPSASAADPVLPSMPDLPEAVEAPASVSKEPSRDTTGLGVVVDARYASVDAIPARALTAYQRAETVMRQADESCHVGWQLVAAIGKVESDHGRFGGALMTADGVVHPAILGPRLSGEGATSRIDDTDAGLLDGDRKFDRAVGPMQFIPSTWTVVGVDADGDERRDPQDIDDASLATAVYLCSGTDDLSTLAGQRAAVYRYNHSKTYVADVLAIMAGYLRADPALFRLVGGTGLLDPGDYPGGGWTVQAALGETQPPSDTDKSSPGSTPSATPTAEPTESATGKPKPPPASTSSATPSAVPSAAAPSASPSEQPVNSDPPAPTDSAAPTPTPTATPTESPSDPPTPVVIEDPLVAWSECVAAGVPAADLAAMTACLVDLTGRPADDPAILAVLASPPSTPPASAGTQQPRSRRRRR